MPNINVAQNIDSWIQAERDGVEFPVPFEIAWAIAGYSRKDNAKRGLSKLEKGVDFSSSMRSVRHSKGSSASATEKIFLTCDAFKQFCMLAETEEGRATRLYFIDAEKKWRLVQAIAPELAANIELQRLKNQGLSLEAERAKVDLQLVQFRHMVTTTLPEPIQQKILGYKEVKTTEFVDRTIGSDGAIYDGIGVTYIQKRYGFKSTKQVWDWLESIGCGKLSGHWASQLSAVERQILPRELLPKLDELALEGIRQTWLGE